MVVDGEIRYFTNLSQSYTNKSEKQITDEFSAYGRYLYYNPDRVEIKTNTQMTTEEMREILGSTNMPSEKIPESGIGVDTSYEVNDSLARPGAAFVSFMPLLLADGGPLGAGNDPVPLASSVPYRI